MYYSPGLSLAKKTDYIRVDNTGYGCEDFIKFRNVTAFNPGT